MFNVFSKKIKSLAFCSWKEWYNWSDIVVLVRSIVLKVTLDFFKNWTPISIHERNGNSYFLKRCIFIKGSCYLILVVLQIYAFKYYV